jgi:hypothetical protein
MDRRTFIGNHDVKRIVLLLVTVIYIPVFTFAQPRLDSILQKIDPQKWSASIKKRTGQLEENIIAKSEKTLHRLQRQEEKIYRRMLTTKDSLQAKAALADIKTKYKSFEDKLNKPAIAGKTRQYIPKLDTLVTSLKFLDQAGAAGNIKNALAATQSLQDKFGQAEEIKNFIRQRREQLKQQLENLGLAKQLKKYNQEVYYYSEQLKEYKSLLSDSKKAERKALDLLSKTKLFTDFMRKSSMLASLFRLPGDPNDPLAQASLAGLQTRAQVNNLIQQQLSSGGPGAQAQFQQNMQDAQSQMNQLKNKLAQYGSSSSDDILPEGFKPNNQRTKAFWNRVEYGTNFQSQRATNLFPVTSDIGISVGYKLNDRSVIGIGTSYKLGWGSGWNHIKLSNEGIGLRSFVDWKIKGSFWLSGGYEQNYKTAFADFAELKDYNGWQQSGLLGLSKVVSLKTKFFKNTKLQLLWDFLSYQQVPRTQPVVFRIGYSIK